VNGQGEPIRDLREAVPPERKDELTRKQKANRRRKARARRAKGKR
jgi:hypothetical protein